MKLSSSLASALALLSASGAKASSSASPAVTVHENFLSPDEIADLLGSIELDDDSVDTYYGPTVLPPSISNRLRDLGGTCGLNEKDCASIDGRAAGGDAVMTMLMTSTTDRHQDCHVPQSEGRVVKDGDVAFVFLESDPHARFEHGEEETVPVKAGNLVKFRGDVPHRTFVPPGSRVRIAGPFHLRSMEYVGSCANECEVPEDCMGGEWWGPFYSECKECRLYCSGRRELEEEEGKKFEAKENAMANLRALSSEEDFHRAMQANCREICYCLESKGACCLTLPNGKKKCQNNMTHHACMASGRQNTPIFFGSDSQCPDDKESCPINADIPVGECCFHDRSPMQVQLSYCEVFVQGEWMGPNSPPGSCKDSSRFGACCFEDTCRWLTRGECTGVRKGDFKGEGSDCYKDCYGSCCGGAKGCEIVTQTAYENGMCEDGAVFAVGGNCFAETCPKKCEAILESAEDIVVSPDSIERRTANTQEGANYKDTFPGCGATIMDPPVKSTMFNIITQTNRLIKISTCKEDIADTGSEFDVSLTVYKGGCDDLECVAADEESPNCQSSGDATVEFCTEGDTEFHLMVHGFDIDCNLAMGEFTVGVEDYGSCGTPPPTPCPPPSGKGKGKGKGGSGKGGSGKGHSGKGGSGKGHSGKGHSGKGGSGKGHSGKGGSCKNPMYCGYYDGKFYGKCCDGYKCYNKRCVPGGSGKGGSGKGGSGKGGSGGKKSGKGKGGSSDDHSYDHGRPPRPPHDYRRLGARKDSVNGSANANDESNEPNEEEQRRLYDHGYDHDDCPDDEDDYDYDYRE